MAYADVASDVYGTTEIGSAPLDLQAAFGVPSEEGIHVHGIVREVTKSSDVYGTFEMNPWTLDVDLYERLSQMISRGLHKEALILLENELIGSSKNYAKDVMQTLGHVFQNLSANGFESQVSAFASLFEYSGLGQVLSFDFGDSFADLSSGIDITSELSLGVQKHTAYASKNTGDVSKAMSAESMETNMSALQLVDPMRAMQLYANELNLNPPSV